MSYVCHLTSCPMCANPMHIEYTGLLNTQSMFASNVSPVSSKSSNLGYRCKSYHRELTDIGDEDCSQEPAPPNPSLILCTEDCSMPSLLSLEQAHRVRISTIINRHTELNEVHFNIESVLS